MAKSKTKPPRLKSIAPDLESLDRRSVKVAVRARNISYYKNESLVPANDSDDRFLAKNIFG